MKSADGTKLEGLPVQTKFSRKNWMFLNTEGVGLRRNAIAWNAGSNNISAKSWELIS